METWIFLRDLAQDYPMDPDYQQVQNYKELLVALRYVIPNPSERSKYAYYLDQTPVDPYLTNRLTFLSWIQKGSNQLVSTLDVEHRILMDRIWSYLWAVGQAYPNQPNFQEVLFYKNFFLTLENTLPGAVNRRVYVGVTHQVPVDRFLTSRTNLVKWLRIVHYHMTAQPPEADSIVEHFGVGHVRRHSAAYASVVLLGCAVLLYLTR
uniref:thiol oxidase n=1 Tax=viral metagenome TaxID=1070528 RepID=A0A6C0BLT2_9ZZZZ